MIVYADSLLPQLGCANFLIHSRFIIAAASILVLPVMVAMFMR
jgi:hypothetical protein